MQNWSKVPRKRAALGEHGGEETFAYCSVLLLVCERAKRKPPRGDSSQNQHKAAETR
jgi:hypothetical protein